MQLWNEKNKQRQHGWKLKLQTIIIEVGATWKKVEVADKEYINRGNVDKRSDSSNGNNDSNEQWQDVAAGETITTTTIELDRGNNANMYL